MGSTPFGGKNVKGNIAEAGANSKFTCVERQHHTPVLFRGQLPKFGAVLRAWFSDAVLVAARPDLVMSSAIVRKSRTHIGRITSKLPTIQTVKVCTLLRR